MTDDDLVGEFLGENDQSLDGLSDLQKRIARYIIYSGASGISVNVLINRAKLSTSEKKRDAAQAVIALIERGIVVQIKSKRPYGGKFPTVLYAKEHNPNIVQL